MRLTISVLTCLCLILSASTVPAKEKKPDKPMDQQAMMELWKKMAMPGEPHKLFSSLAGNWTTTSKEWMEPGKPPTESTGTAEMKMLLDGRFGALHQVRPHLLAPLLVDRLEHLLERLLFGV